MSVALSISGLSFPPSGVISTAASSSLSIIAIIILTGLLSRMSSTGFTINTILPAPLICNISYCRCYATTAAGSSGIIASKTAIQSLTDEWRLAKTDFERAGAAAGYILTAAARLGHNTTLAPFWVPANVAMHELPITCYLASCRSSVRRRPSSLTLVCVPTQPQPTLTVLFATLSFTLTFVSLLK